jgi:hypothetical protein
LPLFSKGGNAVDCGLFTADQHVSSYQRPTTFFTVILSFNRFSCGGLTRELTR